MATPKDLVISSKEYSVMSNKLRDFFRSKRFEEAYAQNRLDTLSACENPFNVATFPYLGQVWPLRQTNQMALEVDIMSRVAAAREEGDRAVPTGLYCFTTSYRNELPEDMVPGRHFTIFPMIEFEIPNCDMEGLISFEKELIRSLGYTGEFAEIDFEDACERYSVRDITHLEEDKLCHELAPVVFLKNFPDRSQPFWNMKRNKDNIALKVDVLLLGTHGGMETIGSAQREESVSTMKHNFNTVSEGGYAEMMYEKFGKERVDCELAEYFALAPYMVKRSGGGIGGTRMLNFMRHFDLLEDSSVSPAEPTRSSDAIASSRT